MSQLSAHSSHRGGSSFFSSIKRKMQPASRSHENLSQEQVSQEQQQSIPTDMGHNHSRQSSRRFSSRSNTRDMNSSSQPTKPSSQTAGESAPPAYTAVSNAAPFPAISTGSPEADDPYAFLSSFDTVFLIDDSGSMQGKSWRETKDALETIIPVCVQHDADGIDIYFLVSSPAQPSPNSRSTS